MKRSRVQVPFAARMVLKEWHCLNGRGDNPVTFFYSPPLPKEGWEECQYKPLVGASAHTSFKSRLRLIYPLKRRTSALRSLSKCSFTSSKLRFFEHHKPGISLFLEDICFLIDVCNYPTAQNLHHSIQKLRGAGELIFSRKMLYIFNKIKFSI